MWGERAWNGGGEAGAPAPRALQMSILDFILRAMEDTENDVSVNTDTPHCVEGLRDAHCMMSNDDPNPIHGYLSCSFLQS